MNKGRILLSFLAVSAILIGGTLGALTLHTSSKADAAQLHIHFISRRVTPTPTRISTPTPTRRPIPTPTPTLKLEATPIPTITLSSAQSISDYLLDQVNNYRKQNGLATVSSNPEACSFAAIRAQEISASFNHDGFTNRINNHTLPYTSYRKITENIAMNSDYKGVVNQWINSPGHAENMRADTPSVCIAKYGNYYAYEGWKP